MVKKLLVQKNDDGKTKKNNKNNFSESTAGNIFARVEDYFLVRNQRSSFEFYKIINFKFKNKKIF